jgi:hypothetical protein|tara:strand:+ start:484 stop:876 length:393 start_codon:yes stop_codon:yes gene_type:complete
MATVTAKISLSSNTLLSNPLKISSVNTVSAKFTTGLARQAITSTAKGTPSGQVTLYTAGTYTVPMYLYVKNTDSKSTDYVNIYVDTSSDDPDLLKLAGGEWAFLPLNDATLKAYTATSGTVVEWIVYANA